MKHNGIKAILSVLTVAAMCLSGSFTAFAESGKSQLQAQDALASLTNTFEISKSGEYIYPDDFAGTWYDDGILHVVVTDEHGISDYKEILKDHDCVEYELARFSLNELSDIQKKLSGDMQSIEGLVTIGVDQKHNKIRLGVCDIEKNGASVRKKVWSIVNENNNISRILSNDTDNSLDFDDLFIVFGAAVPTTDSGGSSLPTAGSIAHIHMDMFLNFLKMPESMLRQMQKMI